MRIPPRRFSLRRLLTAFTVMALILTAVGYFSRDWRNEFIVRQQLGAHSVRIDSDGSVAAYFENPIVWKRLVPVKRFSFLDLKAVAINDNEIEQLAKLEHVKMINFSGTDIQDHHIAELAKIGGLKTLWVSHTQLSDECIDSLIALPELESALLKDTNVTEQGVARLHAAKPELFIVAPNGKSISNQE